MKQTLITNGYIITVDKDFSIHKKGAVLIENDKIVDIGPSQALEGKYPQAERIDASGKALIPGLINTHIHSGLIRGTAEDLPLWEWITKHVDPAHRVLTPEDAYVAANMCYGESLLAGTTCVMDMYRHMDRCADAAKELGMRAVLVPYVADREGYEYFESLDDNEKLVKSRHGDADGRIQVWIGLEHLAYCSEAAFTRAGQLAKHYNTGIHTHGEESVEMTLMIERKYGKSPIKLFYDRGILGEKTVLAHCVWLTPYEMDIMKKTGTGIAHCPVSNMKLASGVAPVPEYLKKGIKVGLGTDGIKENNSLDMFDEMKFASLLQKVHHLDAGTMTAKETLKLATIGGAQVLGLDDQIGSLEKGKKADLVLVDLERLHLAPILEDDYANILPNLVFSASGADVDTVFVNGDIVVKDHQLVQADYRQLVKDATKATKDLIERRKPFIPDNPTINDVQI